MKSIRRKPQNPLAKIEEHSHAGGGPAVEIKDLHVRFDAQSALENINLKIENGLQVAVVGPNGAGKSTLFNVLAGVLPATKGEVMVHGHAPDEHLCTAYVTQSKQVDWSFPVNVRDVVLMGRTGLLGLFRAPSERDHAIVQHSLERVGIADLAERQIAELSGGQQQRMFIARALAQEADLVLLDESLAGLDLNSRKKIFEILDGLKEEDASVLFATHDLNLAGEHFDRILLLDRVLVAYGPPEQVLTPENLSAAYGGQVQLVETEDGAMIMGDMGGHHEHDEEGRHG